MAGPTASVLLRNSIDNEALDGFMSLAFERSGGFADDWHVVVPAAFGMPAELAEAGAVGVGLREPSARPVLADVLGFSPPAEIAVWMWCNQDVDHRMLGYLCLAMALEYDGLINFGGQVNLVAPDDMISGASDRERRAERDRKIAGRVRRMPGRVYLVNYGSLANPVNGHIGDAEFMDGWLRHPRFRMIK